MFGTKAAVLFVLDPFRVKPLVLIGVIVALFAIATRYCNSITRHTFSTRSQIRSLFQNIGNDTGADRAAAFSDGKAKLFFHRYWSY